MPEPTPAPLPPVSYSRRTIWTARFIAMGADLLQIVVFPLFGEGWLSPLNNALDIAVGVVLVKLLGFHWAFLPTFAAETMPIFDLVPTWTGAVFLVTGMQSRPWLKKVLVVFSVLVAALFVAGIWWFVRGPRT